MRYQLGIPKIYKTEALVIKRMNLGETDRIVTLYTPGYGKIRAIAKGVRKPTSRLGGHLELLTRSNLMIARGQNLDIITQGQTIENFLNLKNDLWRTGLSFYVLELIDRFTEENIQNQTVYKLLLDTLKWLETTKDGELTLRFFELHLLSHLGYKPQLQRCTKCMGDCENSPFFSFDGGGVVCPRCSKEDLRGLEITVGALKALRFLQENSFAVASRLKVNGNLSGELQRILKGYIRYLLEHELKSAEFLDNIRAQAAST